ncbi:MAG: hypothetical protein L0220_15880 [Acidobacteria bacterium]|nr:hypothetical protein [Acidobacteriota bacterium]
MALNDLQPPDGSNSETFRKLVSAAVGRAYWFYGHCSNPADVDDLTQSIILSLIKDDEQGLHSFKHLTSEKRWLQAIANHAVLRFFRGQKDLVSLKDLTPDDSACPPNQEIELSALLLLKYARECSR